MPSIAFLRAVALFASATLLAPSVAAARLVAETSARAASGGVSDGLDLSNADPNCPACRDFFEFADGLYARRHPIPADRSGIGSFDLLQDRNLARERVLFGALAASAARHPETDAGRIGTFYGACLDTAGRDAAGLTPVAPELAKIDGMTDTSAVVAELASLARLGVPVVFAFDSTPDERQSSRTIGELSDGDLGLPEREYYLRTDARSKTERLDYATYVGKLLALSTAVSGASPDPAASADPAASSDPGSATPASTPTIAEPASGVSTADLLALETSLAKVQPTRAERRDPVANYHLISLGDLQTRAPGIGWTAYFTALGAPPMATLDVDRPEYVAAAARIVTSTPLPVWKAYLRFRLLGHYAYELPTAYDDLAFAFYGTELTGATKHRPQWQRCVSAANGQLQDIVSTAYAERYFTPQAKARAVAQIRSIHAALHDDLATLAWMQPRTRARAERKLALMVKKIGYPDHPRSYADLHLTAGPYAQQMLATTSFGFADDMSLIGKPTDRTRWGMPAPEVNAYYDPSNNEIVFPAGILGRPFFDPSADDAVNYGGIGAVMGHETTHGFDDEGRQFDEYGDLDDWWQPSDAANFKARAACIVRQYSSYTIDGVHLNGEAVQGEAVADLGGLTLAYRAFERTPEARAGVKLGGYTPEQRFFLSFAQVWAENQRPAAAREQALTDPHPVAMWRVIGTLSNMPEFQKAFHCKSFDAMVRKARCRIW